MITKTSVCTILVATATSLLLAASALSAAPPTPPIFASNYKLEGVLSLPYAELNEPFVGWFDGKAQKSRADFYGDLYQVLQLGPDPSATDFHRFGVIYKFAWVPSSLKNNSAINSRTTDASQQQQTARACFKIPGSEQMQLGAQSLLPSLGEFHFDSVGRCPKSANAQHRHHHHQCELWTQLTQFGDTSNTYKFWLRRNQNNEPIPVFYFMQGYDSLLGSHYDRYELSYVNYEPNGALPSDFELDVHKTDRPCESMPGPGAAASQAELRSYAISANPLHAFVSEPHRYDHIEEAHNQFTQKFKPNYDDNNKAKRRARINLMHNLRLIEAHNRRLKSYKLAVNKFADAELGELSYLRSKLRGKKNAPYNGGLPYPASTSIKQEQATGTPSHWDWRLHGAVTPVKDQAVCGSCWSFGTTGALEGALFVQAGARLTSLSQQQLIDCSWPYGNNGCDGGEDFRAYKYIKDAGGLASEDNYGRYLAVDGKCHDSQVNKTLELKGFLNVTTNSAQALRDAIVKYGPVSISIDASRPTFTFYSHGVYYDDQCKNGPDELDHAVLAVGFGSMDGQQYWLVKNSWSTYWGNDGYILMAERHNNCGVLTAPTVPLVAKK